MRMVEDPSHMTERILNLTLDIIYLLTGESFPPLKSGDHLTITVPSVHSLKSKRNNDKKIVDIANKIIDLLTGEEWEYLEGHKDLYKHDMMEHQPHLTSMDESSNGNPPERCPCPLYSLDSTQEDHTITHHHLVDGTEHGEEMKVIKVEVKEEEEERLVSGEQQSMEEGKMIMESKQEESSLHMDTNGCDVRNPSERHLLLSADYKSEDNVITQDPPGGNPNTQNIHHRPSCPETSMDPSDQGESSHQSHTMFANIYLGSHTADRSTDRSIPKESPLPHEGVYGGENLFSCSECGKCFTVKGTLVRHQEIHTGNRPFSCSECAKSFLYKEVLVRHLRVHTGERPYSCSECGKSFTVKGTLVRHQKIHSGNRPFSCSECKRSFLYKEVLVRHLKSHMGERPYSCLECGKSFTQKGSLDEHQKIHTGERPYSCPECGKSFTRKGDLVRHQKTHTSERRYSCTECGKCFIQKRHLVKHQRTHIAQSPQCIQTAGNVLQVKV